MEGASVKRQRSRCSGTVKEDILTCSKPPRSLVWVGMILRFQSLDPLLREKEAVTCIPSGASD